MIRGASGKIDPSEIRLQGMTGLAQVWQETFKDQPIAQLLGDFQSFAQQYFRFFRDTTVDLELEKKDAMLKRILRTLRQEWLLISRACEQRHVSGLIEDLNAADKVAEELYSRFTGYKPAPSPIVYFDKADAITRYVFTSKALISLELQFYNDGIRDQAIAHELGHHIYWNTAPIEVYQELQTRLKESVLGSLIVPTGDPNEFQKWAKIIGIWGSWLEETFADVIGTILIGTKFVESAKIRAQEKEFSVEDDGEHPAPYLRPLIAMFTLLHILEPFGLSGDIKKEIDAYNDIRAKGDKQIHKVTGLPMSEVSSCIDVIIDAMLTTQWNSAPDADGKTFESDLRSLFDCSKWIDDLSGVRVQTAAGQMDDGDHKYPENNNEYSLERLKSYLEGKIKKEQKIRGKKLDDAVLEALLTLDLGEEKNQFPGDGYTFQYYGAGLLFNGQQVNLYYIVPN